MADEYITRESALKVAIGWREQLLPNYGENDEYVKCLETVAEHLYDIPAADVRPVVRGRWIESYSGWTPTKKCSACGSHFWQFAMKDVGVGDKVAPVLNFCPNCGADMREAEPQKCEDCRHGAHWDGVVICGKDGQRHERNETCKEG